MNFKFLMASHFKTRNMLATQLQLFSDASGHEGGRGRSGLDVLLDTNIFGVRQGQVYFLPLSLPGRGVAENGWG